MLVDLKDFTDWVFYFERVTVDIYTYLLATGIAYTVCVIKCNVTGIFQFSYNTDFG